MKVAMEVRLAAPVDAILKDANFATRRRRALKRVDRELSRGNFKDALSLVKQLQGKPFGLRGFGAAKQVPKNGLVLHQFEVNGKDLSPLRQLVESVMDSIEKPIVEDSEGRECSCEDAHFLCLQHEAGHFLVGYLLGALPKRYRVPSLEELKRGNFAGGKVEFVGFEFLRRVGAAQMPRKNNIEEEESSHRGKRNRNRSMISSKTLNNFCCITLGGLVVEHLVFGRAEGHYSDMNKLREAIQWLGLSTSEAQFQVRWAALNTVFLLHRHHKARLKLVKAMLQGYSVCLCIDAIENALDDGYEFI